MDCLMHIGNKFDQKSRVELAKLIGDVFESGFKTHMGEAVLVKALDVCQQVFEVKNVTVSGCSLSGIGKKEK